jgi:hypothetical protein
MTTAGGRTWRAILFVAAIAASAVGCADVERPSRSPSATVFRFALLYNPDGFCPLTGGSAITFVIDPLAGQPTLARIDDGRLIPIHWPSGFIGGTVADPVVRDAVGLEVARDGERLAWPPEGFPNLHGYFVCDGGDALWIVVRTPDHAHLLAV